VTGSLNHYAFGAVCGFIWRRVIGIDALEPGFKTIAFRPLIDPRLPGAAGDYESAMGRVSCAWRRTNGGLAVDVTVPANATARVHLPVPPGATVRESRRTVNLLERTETEAVVQVGSGSYSFTVTA
jgi:alpha-L-rhamnosidase